MIRFPLVEAIVATIGLVLAFAIGIAIAEGRSTVVIGFCASGFALLAIANPRLLSVAAVVLFYSGLTLPPIIGRLNLFHIAVAALLIAVIIRYSFDRGIPFFWSKAHFWLLAFVGVVLATIAFRGAGLKVLGDEKWGGMFYVQLILCATLILTLPRLTISAVKWRPVLSIAFLASFLPAIAGYLMIKSGIFSSALGGFIQVDSQVGFSLSALDTGGIVRQTSLGVSGQSLFYLVLLYFPIAILFSARGFIGLFLVVMAFLLVGLSGYRTAFISILLTAFFLLAWTKSLSFGRIFLAGLAVLLIYSSALLFSKSMHPAVQRMLSILPGVEVQGFVEADASATIEWRWKLWERGMQEVQKYWLIGRGYAFSSRELEAAQATYGRLADPTDWAVATTSYHQGILSLVVGLGVPGLITGLAMLCLFSRRHLAFQKEAWADQNLKLCHQVFTALLVVGLFKFVLIYGDVQVSFPEFFYIIAILEAMWAANLSKNATEKKSF